MVSMTKRTSIMKLALIISGLCPCLLQTFLFYDLTWPHVSPAFVRSSLRRPDLPEPVWPRDPVEELQVFLMECQSLEHVDMRGVYDAIDERFLAAIGKNLLSLRSTSAKLSPEIIGRYCPRLRTLGTDVVEGDTWLDCVIRTSTPTF